MAEARKLTQDEGEDGGSQRTCVVTRASLSAPNAMMVQEIEVRGDGVAPSTGV